MKKYLVVFCICLSVIISGCNKETRNYDDKKEYVSATISSDEAKSKVEDGAILIDVRTLDEYNNNHIDKAVLLPVDEISLESISKITEDKKTDLIVYCASGNRSARAVEILNKLGYTNVYDLGSINNWLD